MGVLGAMGTRPSPMWHDGMQVFEGVVVGQVSLRNFMGTLRWYNWVYV